ncbi:MAG: YbhB/YbcL family Raf kinase inhibitor-like protein [Oligoflexales bacterium]
MTLNLESPSFRHENPIPEQFSGEGEDRSPFLKWNNAPEGTAEFALICEDPDAPVPEPWVHWLVYNIPSSYGSLSEDFPRKKEVETVHQGLNSWSKVGYNGPLPPRGHGRHHYHFKLYALDNPIAIRQGATKSELLSAISGHVLEEADLVGTYQR